MAEYTENLKLFKYDPITDAKQVFSISDALNYNWDILDKNGAGGWNLFDTKITDHILTGDEALGWALQGSLVTMTYPDAVNRIKELYTAGTDTTYRGISCKKTTDGRYIADISQKTAIDTVYSETGIADFYILDSTNNQFYLPRNKYFMQLTDSPTLLNNYNEAGLPNITGKTGNLNINGYDQNFEGALFGSDLNGKSAAGSGNYGTRINIDASRSSSVYGNSDTVQPPSSNKLLYYKVGHTVTNSGSIDVANVLSDINLLETNKADKDLSNCTKPYVTETYKNGASWYRVWSDGWCEQGGYCGSNGDYTFLKTFKDTNYTVSACTGNDAGNSYAPVWNNKRTDKIYFYRGGTHDFDWQVAGYIA